MYEEGGLELHRNWLGIDIPARAGSRTERLWLFKVFAFLSYSLATLLLTINSFISKKKLAKKNGEMESTFHEIGEMLAYASWDDHKAEMAQVIFEVAGYPLQGGPEWSDFVGERLGAHGRELYATKAISGFTFMRVPKVRLQMTDAELADLQLQISAFNKHAVPAILGYPSIFSVMVQDEDIPRGSDITYFVGKFLRGGLLENEVVQDLMAYDAFEFKEIGFTLSRLKLGDVLCLHFWRLELKGEFEADTIWRVFSFVLSHSFLNDENILTFSPFCKANCPTERWDWYLAGSDMAVPPPSHRLSGLDKLIGNFEDVAPWGRQTDVGPGQVPADECVIFMKDVAVGEPVEMDYGDIYMLARDKQLLQFRGDKLEELIEKVLANFDARVLAAFRAYMGGVTFYV